MARTKRNPAWPNVSKQTYIDHQYRYPETRTVRTRKPKSVYKAQVLEAAKHARIENILQRNPTTRTWEYRDVLVTPRVSRFITQYDVPYPQAEQDKDNAEKYDTWFRDGKLTETGRNTGFKKRAQRELRNANRRYCTRVMRDQEDCDDVYPCSREQKHLIWAFW